MGKDFFYIYLNLLISIHLSWYDICHFCANHCYIVALFSVSLWGDVVSCIDVTQIYSKHRNNGMRYYFRSYSFLVVCMLLTTIFAFTYIRLIPSSCWHWHLEYDQLEVWNTLSITFLFLYMYRSSDVCMDLINCLSALDISRILSFLIK